MVQNGGRRVSLVFLSIASIFLFFSLDCTLERKKDENTELSFIRTRYRIEFYQDAINYYLLDTPYPKIGDANLKCAL